ncbi:hypothetical protein Plhal304r1_c074g0161961 [Plasmopara halstedii]
MSIIASSDNLLLDSIPRLRWSPVNNRFHFNMPMASEPGEYGFVLLQEFQRADSVNSMCLPLKERQHLGEMERINNSIHDVENAVQLHETVKVLKQKRMHNQEYHERVPNEDEGRLTIRQHKAPKREFESRRKKCIRMRRVHQPK